MVVIAVHVPIADSPFSSNCYRSAAVCAENPVVITTVRQTGQTVRELRDGHAVRRALPWRALEAEFLDWIARRRAKSLTLGIVSAIFS